MSVSVEQKEYSADGYDVYFLTKTSKGVKLDLDIINKLRYLGYKEDFIDYLMAVLNTLPKTSRMTYIYHVKILPTKDQTAMLSFSIEESMVDSSDVMIMLSIPNNKSCNKEEVTWQ